MRKQIRRWAVVAAAVILLAMAAPAAWGHARLTGSDPADGAVLPELPAAVRLTFSERVEVGTSIFKVYPLADDEDEARLRAAAGQLVEQVLQLRQDGEQRADAGVAADGSVAQEIQILLKEGLAPGPYVVMWRVLSVDTHVTQGFLVFRVQPGEAGS